VTTKLADHYIMEFHGCSPALLDDAEFTENTLTEAARQCGATILNVYTHKFAPQGVTTVIALSESHMSSHSWPELGSLLCDVCTCGSHIQIDKAVEVIREAFNPTKHSTIRMDRGTER